MAKTETKDLEVKKTAEVAVYDDADWGAGNAENRDMLLPRIALMHGTSKLVTQDKCVPGDIVNTATGKVLANKTGAVEVIPVKMLPKTWVVSVDGKWDRTELSKPGEDRDWEQETDEGTEKHERCLNFYVLVRSELASGEAIPYLLSFKGTSFKAGQKLVNHFKLSQGIKKAPARTSWKLSSGTRSDESNTWRVWEIDEIGEVKPEELNQAYTWLQNLRTLDDNNVTKYEQEGGSSAGAGAKAFTREAGEMRAEDQF